MYTLIEDSVALRRVIDHLFGDVVYLHIDAEHFSSSRENSGMIMLPEDVVCQLSYLLMAGESVIEHARLRHSKLMLYVLSPSQGKRYASVCQFLDIRHSLGREFICKLVQLISASISAKQTFKEASY